VFRNILHLDIRDFCIVLERQRQPDLRGWPVAIAPGQGRTVIQTASLEARQEGIQPGMLAVRARQRCRRLTIVPPDFSFYRQVQERLLAALGTFSPLVEQAGWGHFFIDATGTRLLWGAVLDAADRMRRLVVQNFQLDSAVGLASNKLVSRVAARVIRIRELCDVFPGVEASFLAPLGVNLLPGVGEMTTTRLLADLNLRTVGELAVVPPPLLGDIFGAAGQRLHRMALGEDPSPVVAPKSTPILREEIQLAEDDNQRPLLLGHLYGVVERLGRRLRSQNCCPGELVFSVTYADGVQTRIREQFPADGCEFHLDSVLFRRVLRFFDRALQRRLRIRRFALSAARLQPPIGQLPLFSWDDPHDSKEMKLLQALDHLRNRHGEAIISYGKTSITGNTVRGTQAESNRTEPKSLLP
jgi:DNA polymerase-4